MTYDDLHHAEPIVTTHRRSRPATRYDDVHHAEPPTVCPTLPPTVTTPALPTPARIAELWHRSVVAHTVVDGLRYGGAIMSVYWTYQTFFGD